MSNVLIHKDRFPGAIDNGNQNEVGPNAWLKEHVFQGGSDGQVLVRDSAQSDGASWTENLTVDADAGVVSIPGALALGSFQGATADLGVLRLPHGAQVAGRHRTLAQNVVVLDWGSANDTLTLGGWQPGPTTVRYIADSVHQWYLGGDVQAGNLRMQLRDTLGNAAGWLSNFTVASKGDDGTGFLARMTLLHANGTEDHDLFAVKRDGGVRIQDYLILGPNFLNSNGGPIFGATQAMIAVFPDLAATSDTACYYACSNGLDVDLMHLDQLASIDPDGTIHGARKFTFDAFGRATAALEWVAPYFVGGTAAASGLEIRATHGNANASSFIDFTTGNDGGLRAMRIDNSARVGIGIVPAATFHVGAAEARMQDTGSGFCYWSFYATNGTTRRGVVGMNNGGNDLDLNAETGVLRLTGNSGIKLTGSLGFYGTTPIAQQVLATGAGRTVDNVISALQAVGLVKQS